MFLFLELPLIGGQQGRPEWLPPSSAVFCAGTARTILIRLIMQGVLRCPSCWAGASVSLSGDGVAPGPRSAASAAVVLMEEGAPEDESTGPRSGSERPSEALFQASGTVSPAGQCGG